MFFQAKPPLLKFQIKLPQERFQRCLLRNRVSSTGQERIPSNHLARANQATARATWALAMQPNLLNGAQRL